MIIAIVKIKAAITNYHKLGGIKQQKFILWKFWRLEVRNHMSPGCAPSGLQGRILPPLPLSASVVLAVHISLACSRVMPIFGLRHIPPSHCASGSSLLHSSFLSLSLSSCIFRQQQGETRLHLSLYAWKLPQLNINFSLQVLPDTQQGNIVRQSLCHLKKNCLSSSVQKHGSHFLLRSHKNI